LFDKLSGYVIYDAVVPVLASEPHVSFDGDGLEPPLRQAHESHIESAAAQIVDQNRL